MEDPIKKFQQECSAEIQEMKKDTDLQGLSRVWVREITPHKYAYHFTWLGRPIIQFPQDVVAVQELIWKMSPDLIIETGVAHGGSLILSASLLELLGGDRLVVGIDIDIRPHNRQELEAHPLYKRIRLIEGSSIAPDTLKAVSVLATGRRKIMVILDSNHTHEHVLQELRLYSPFVKKDGFLIAMDTVVDDMPDSFFDDRPWGRGDNPKTAVRAFLAENDRFVVDTDMDAKLLISSNPEGYLRCVRD